MNDSPQLTKNIQQGMSKTGSKAYSIALRTGAIGCISSLILALLAVLTLFIEGGDSAGPGFFIFGILALSVLTVSGAVAILISLVGIINGAATLIQTKNLKEENANNITKNFGLILLILFMMAMVFKLLRNW